MGKNVFFKYLPLFDYKIIQCFRTINPYKPKFVDTPGLGHGLTVVINDSYENYAYNVYSSVSTKVQTLSCVILFSRYIFSLFFQIAVLENDVYPEVASTGFSETHAMAGREMYIAIDPTIIVGEELMRRYKPTARKCFFRDETVLLQAGYKHTFPSNRNHIYKCLYVFF